MKHLPFFFLAFCVGFSTHAQVPSYVPTDGLVVWYPFNGNANDESMNGHDATVDGATLSTDRYGILQSAYSFDGNGWGIFQNFQSSGGEYSGSSERDSSATLRCIQD